MDGDDIAKASAPASRRRMTVSETSVPALPRGARLRYDESRGRWVPPFIANRDLSKL